MTICKACGAMMSEKRVFCGNCGEALAERPVASQPTASAVYVPHGPGAARPNAQPVDQTTPNPTPSSAKPKPSYPDPLSSLDQAPIDYSPYALVSAWTFFGAMILLNIPIVGWVFTIVWACGGVYNHNLVRFARAQLLCWAAFAIVVAGIFLLTGVPFANILKLITKP